MELDGFIGPRDYQGIDIKVFGRSTAEKYVPIHNEVVISIRCFGDDIARLNPDFKDYLYLEFDDCKTSRDGVEINDVQVYKTVEFVRKHIDVADRIVIHCFAGISRSRSIAAAIADGFNLPYKFTAVNSTVYNKVYRQIKNEG